MTRVREREKWHRDAKIDSHSTTSIAGNFAKQIGTKRSVLNDTSSQYKGVQSLESILIMTRIGQEALSGLEEVRVATEWDFMILAVPQNGVKLPIIYLIVSYLTLYFSY